jgi:hypothetical protein
MRGPLNAGSPMSGTSSSWLCWQPKFAAVEVRDPVKRFLLPLSHNEVELEKHLFLTNDVTRRDFSFRD